MAPGWFVQGETYDVPVKHPDTGEEATVTLRELDAGAQADIEDTLVVRYGEDGEEADISAKVGAMKLITVEKVIVSWTIPGPPPTAASIRQLHPKVLEKIFEAVGSNKEAATQSAPLPAPELAVAQSS